MHLSDNQIRIIRQRLPDVLEAARGKDPRIHSLGVGRKRNGDEFGEDYAVVIFTLGDSVDHNILKDLSVITIEGDRIVVPTDIVQCEQAVFAYCVMQRPSHGGNCVATIDTGLRGTLGGAIIDPDGKHHFVSAAHLLTNFGSKSVNDDVIQPSNDAEATIGKLVKLGPKWPPYGGRMKADAALVSVPGGTDDLTYEILGIGEIADTKPPAEKMGVLVRGAETSSTMVGEILYVKCATTVTHQQRDYIFSDVFLTARLSQGGDSGALAIENADATPKKVVGLLFAHNDQFTYFADVDDCVNVLEISGWHWGKP